MLRKTQLQQDSCEHPMLSGEVANPKPGVHYVAMFHQVCGTQSTFSDAIQVVQLASDKGTNSWVVVDTLSCGSKTLNPDAKFSVFGAMTSVWQQDSDRVARNVCFVASQCGINIYLKDLFHQCLLPTLCIGDDTIAELMQNLMVFVPQLRLLNESEQSTALRIGCYYLALMPTLSPALGVTSPQRCVGVALSELFRFGTSHQQIVLMCRDPTSHSPRSWLVYENSHMPPLPVFVDDIRYKVAIYTLSPVTSSST